MERTSEAEREPDTRAQETPEETPQESPGEVAPGIPAGSGAAGITVPARVVGLLLDHGRAVAAGLVVLLVLGTLTGVDAWLRNRRAADLAAVTAAYADRDCAGVLEAWRQASQAPAFPGRREAPTAAAGGAVGECRDLQAADRLVAGGDADAAFSAYLRLRRERPKSPLAAAVVGPRLVSVLGSGDVTAAPGLCRELRGAVASNVLARADAIAPVLVSCGELLAGTGDEKDTEAAFTLVTQVRRDYGTTPSAPAAAAVEARLRLAQVAGAPHTAVTPFRASPAPGDRTVVRFVNHSPWPVTLTLQGPDGGRVVSLPACPSCGPYLRDISWQQCLGKGAKADLALPAGRFEMALQYSGDGPEPSHGFWNLQTGWYEECYFFVR